MNSANESAMVSAQLVEWYKDPVFYVEHALGHMTWSKQREILRSIRDNENTAVRACHGVSKTFSAAEIVTWFLNTFDNSKVITSAPTFFQIEKQLWAEINNIYATSRIRLVGECLMTEIKTNDKNHFAIGFSTDRPARSEGWHAPAILFIFDEAKGLPRWLWNSARGAMTGGFCRFLAISTTDGVQVGEPYHKIFTNGGDGWNRIHISAFDSPYVTGEKFRGIVIPDLARPDVFELRYTKPTDVQLSIATKKYIDESKTEWGEDSVLYKTKVLGEIADEGADTVIKLSAVMTMQKNFEDAEYGGEGELEAGIDVARGGSDDSVMFLRKGLRVKAMKTVASPQLPEKEKLYFLSEKVEEFVDFNKEMRIKVDDTGVGGGLTDILQHKGYNVIPINFGGEANEKDKYPDVASEMWFEVAKIVHEIAWVPSSRLMSELVNRKQKAQLDKKGRRCIESKKDYKARGFRSPDEADAFLLAFYNPYGGRAPRMWRV